MQAISVTNSGYTKFFREHLREKSFTAKLVNKNELLYRYYCKKTLEISNPWWETANKSFLI